MKEVCAAVIILLLILFGVVYAMAKLAREGYEDNQGFHEGKPQ